MVGPDPSEARRQNSPPPRRFPPYRSPRRRRKGPDCRGVGSRAKRRKSSGARVRAARDEEGIGGDKAQFHYLEVHNITR